MIARLKAARVGSLLTKRKGAGEREGSECVLFMSKRVHACIILLCIHVCVNAALFGVTSLLALCFVWDRSSRQNEMLAFLNFCKPRDVRRFVHVIHIILTFLRYVSFHMNIASL